MLRVETLYEMPGIFAFEIATEYDHAYSEKCYNRLPSISFPVFSCFNYSTGKENYLLTSNEILFENRDIDFKVSKLSNFTSDITVSIQFSDYEHESIKDFIRENRPAGLSRRSPRIEYLVRQLHQGSRSKIWKEHCLIALVNNIRYRSSPDDTLQVNAYSLKLVDLARQYIFANFQNKIQIADIAASVYVSPFHFCRIFKKVTGCSPYYYMLMVRLEEAKKLLKSGETVSQTASSTGFQSIEHFSHAFRLYEKLAPSGIQKIFSN